MSVLDYCDKRIKEAINKEDKTSLETYTEMKEIWLTRLAAMKGTPVKG